MSFVKCRFPNALALLYMAFVLMILPAKALILFGLDNSANQTDPGTGVPFDSVGKVVFGGTTTRGSAIHIGGGYMLTANHVNLTSASVTFNGVDSYTFDPFYAATQVAVGVDMKIFKLSNSNPSVGSAKLYGGTDELVAPATLVGWGRGRDPSNGINTTPVTWGALTTIARRWGLNEPKGIGMIDYSGGGFDYDYEAIITLAGTGTGSPAGLGANEAAATQYDSGGGLFQFLDGKWYLIGLAATVQTNGSSTFGNDGFVSGAGDANYFVRVGTYYDDIVTVIPEPTTTLLWVTGSLLLLRRRRADG